MLQPTEALYQSTYLNARIRGMKSRLFSREQLEECLAQSDVRLTIDLLLQSPYARDMAESLTRYSGVDAVEDALSRNLSRTFRHLLRITRGHLERRTSQFFMHWDLVVVKALIRRHHRPSASPEDFFTPSSANLLPAQFERLSKEPDMERLISQLVAWAPEICSPLLSAFREYRDTEKLAVLEEALDQAYYVRLVEQYRSSSDPSDQQFARMLSMYIDLINLRTLLREKRRYEQRLLERESHEECCRRLQRSLLPGGTLDRTRLRRLAWSQDVATAMELLAPTPYHVLVDGLYQFVQSGRFSPLERILHGLIITDLKKAARADGTGFAVLMHYTWLKFNELLNLRMIVRGRAAGLPVGRIQEELLYA